MIIEDEYADPVLDNEYLFEENENFKVDEINHDNCNSWFNSLADMCIVDTCWRWNTIVRNMISN